MAWIGVEGTASNKETLAGAEVEVTIAPVTTMVPVMVVVESSSTITLLIVCSVGTGATATGVEGEPLMVTDPVSIGLTMVVSVVLWTALKTVSVVTASTFSDSISQGTTTVRVLPSITVGQVVTV